MFGLLAVGLVPMIVLFEGLSLGSLEICSFVVLDVWLFGGWGSWWFGCLAVWTGFSDFWVHSDMFLFCFVSVSYPVRILAAVFGQ